MPGNTRVTPTEPSGDSGPQLLAVFRDDGTAEQVIAELSDRGMQAEKADEDAVIASLQAEMKAESDSLLIGPGLPAHTKEMLVSAVPFTLLMALVGAVVVGGLGWFIEIPNVSFLARVIWFAVIGAVAFATATWFIAGIAGSRASNTIPAAQRGVLVVVHDGSEQTADVLAGHDPIRIDRRLPDGATATVVTEADLHEGLQVEQASRKLKGTDRADD